VRADGSLFRTRVRACRWQTPGVFSANTRVRADGSLFRTRARACRWQTPGVFSASKRERADGSLFRTRVRACRPDEPGPFPAEARAHKSLLRAHERRFPVLPLTGKSCTCSSSLERGGGAGIRSLQSLHKRTAPFNRCRCYLNSVSTTRTSE
jgi:hypothetical protein